MADNKIIFDAALRLGMDPKQIKDLEKLIEKSLKPEVQFDLSALKKASTTKGLVVGGKAQAKASDVSSGKTKFEDLTATQQKAVARAYGQLARQLEQARSFYRELDKMSSQTGVDINAAMVGLRKGIDDLAARVGTLKPALNVPAKEKAAVKQQETAADKKVRLQQKLDARRADQTLKDEARIAAQQARVGSKVSSVLEKQTSKQRGDDLIRAARETAGRTAATRFPKGAEVIQKQGLGSQFRNVDRDQIPDTRSYLNAQLTASKKLHHDMARSLGVEAEETRKAAADTKAYAKALAALNKQLETLNKTRDKQKAQQDIIKKQLRSDEARQAKAVKGSTLARNLKNKTQYETVVGPRGYSDEDSARKVDLSIGSRDDAAREMGRFQRLQKLRADREEKAADAQKAMDKLQDKMSRNKLKDLERDEKSSDRVRKGLEAAAQKEVNARDRAAAALLQYEKMVQQAALRFPKGAAHAATGDVDAIKTVQDASQTKSYLGQRVTAANQMAKSNAAIFGKDSAEAKKAAAEANNYARALGNVSEKMDGLTAKSSGLANTFKAFTRYALGYGALYEMLGGITALISNIAKLDEDLKSIQAVSLSTDKQMESLAGSIERVALNTKFSNEEIADAVRTLVQAGTAAEDINSVVQATANFASATNSSLQVAADLITSTRAVFDDLSDSTIANQLTSAVNISKLQADDLQTIVSLGAQVADSYQITSDQFLAAVSTLRNVGIKPSTVATGLRQAMLEVFSPDAKTVEVMRSRYQALGEEMSAEAIRGRFTGFTETENPLVSALGELKRLGFAGEAQQDFARNFDVRAYNPLLALVKQYDQLLANEAKITFGAPAAEAAAVQMEALTAKFENLGGAITALAASLSGDMVKGIGEAVDAATSGIEQIRAARSESVTGLQVGEGASTAGRAINTAMSGIKGAVDYVTGGGPLGMAYRAATETEDDRNAESLGQSVELSRELNSQLENARARMQTFEEAAGTFDINAARAGQAAGKAAEAVLQAGTAVRQMELGITELFGKTLPEMNDELIKTATEYSKMGSTQRMEKFKEMKKTNPNVEKLDFSQFDIRMNALATEASKLNGYLNGLSTATLDTLVRYNEIVLKAKDKTDDQLTALDIQARAFVSQFENNEDYRNVVLQTSGKSKEDQLVIFENAQQAIADEIRAFSARAVMAGVDEIRNAALGADMERALQSGGNEAAKVQIQAALKTLFNSIDGVGRESVARILEIEKTINATADKLRSRGDMKGFEAVRSFSGAPTREASARIAQGDQQIRDRKTYASDVIVPATKEENFQKYLDSEVVQFTPIQRQAVKTFQGNPAAIRQGAEKDSELYKAFEAIIESYQNSERRRLAVEKEVNDALQSRASLEERLAEVDQKINEKKANKDFSGLSALRDEQASLKTQVATKQLDEAKADLGTKFNTELQGPEGTKQKEKIGRAQRELLKIQTDNEKAKRDDLLEEARITRESRQRTLELVKEEVEKNLDSSIFNQDTGAIEKFRNELDDINAELLELFKEELRVQGVHGQLFDAEVAAKQEQLKKTEDQVTYMEKVYSAQRDAEDRKLQAINNQISEVEANAPGRGGRRYDAMLRSQGLTPAKDEKAYNTQATEAYTKYQGQLESKQETLQGRESRLKQQISVETDPQILKELNLQLYDTQDQLSATKVELAGVNAELADLNYQAESLNNKEFKFGDMFSAEKWKEGFAGAGDLLDDTFNSVSERLAASQYTFENWSANTAATVAGAFESIGDNVSDSLLDMEGKGMSFSDTMKETFSNMGKDLLRSLIKTTTNQAFTSLFSMIGGGPAGGIGGMAMGAIGSLMAKDGGIVKLASGGMIKGAGTARSDSIKGAIIGKGGKRKPVALSNGESVLNAEATRNLGENFVHAANSGSLFRMAEGGAVPPRPAAGSVNMVDTVQKSAEKQGESVATAMQQSPIALTVVNQLDSDATTSSGLKRPNSRKEIFNAIRDDKAKFQTLMNN